MSESGRVGETVEGMNFAYRLVIIKGSGRAILRPLVYPFLQTSYAGDRESLADTWWR